jgi:hypothetical protein
MKAATQNLYRIFNLKSQSVAAFITATNGQKAIDAYYQAGGKAGVIQCEQWSFGYPECEALIYE